MGTLGVGAVGAGGAHVLLSSDPVGAEALADRPVPSLPGMESYESGRVHESEAVDGPRTLLDVDVLRGIQMTNFRVLSAEDSVEPPCDGGDALEYRFAAYGVAHSFHREGPTDDGSFEPVDGGHVVRRTSDDEPRVSIEVSEAHCGAVSLRSHTTAVRTIDDPEAVYEAYAPTATPTTAAVTDHVESELDEPFDYAGPGIGLAQGGLWSGGRATRRIRESTNLPNAPQGARDAWNSGTAWLNRGVLAADVLQTIRDGFETSSVSSFGAHSVAATDDGGPGVRWLADFTVRVPIDGPDVDVDVEQVARFESDQVDHDLEFLPDCITAGIGFTITIPSNPADAGLSSLDLPEITTYEVESIYHPSPTLATNVSSPVTEPASKTASFEVDGDQYGSGFQAVDVGDPEWALDGGTSDEDVLEYEFSRNGPHTVTAMLEPDTERWDGHTDVQSSHRLTFDVGERSHLQPAVEFGLDADVPVVGSPVTANVTSASAPIHSVDGFEWSVTGHTAGAFPTADGADQCVSLESSTSGDSVTFTPECQGLYRIECTVSDNLRSRTVVRDVFVRGDATAAFDATPEAPVVGDVVSLDASSAVPRGGDITEYEWAVIFYPADGDTSMEVHDDIGEQTSFEVFAAGDYRVTLTVVDETADGDTVSETIEAVPTCGDGNVADATHIDGHTVCDLNGDGLYRDVNGDGTLTFGDVTTFFDNQHLESWQRPDLFDFTGDGEVGQADAVELYEYISDA